ncbi:MAG: hypothetical protein GEV12_20645, partial [Micromonosporaceae bacterium]|nr:hypothetical protein [Micromonosporaceae bacterium]
MRTCQTNNPPGPGRRLLRAASPLAAAVLVLALAVPGSAAAEPAELAAGVAELPVVAGEPGVVTLVTGDRVVLEPAEAGRVVAVVEPAPRAGAMPEFEIVEEGADLYVFPTDAQLLVPDVLDRELFNVSKLVEYGYSDGVPVIVTGQPAAAARQATPAGIAVTTPLPSVDGYAATVAPDGGWWST